jgi:YggT family protein
MIPLLQFVNLLLDIAWWIIIIGAVLSWLLAFNVINRHNQVVRTVWESLDRITEPVYRPIRRMLPATGAVDFAPLVALLIIIFIQIVILPNVAAALR